MASDTPDVPAPAEARAVLAFWFDGAPAELHRVRWFPPPNSVRQRSADADVANRFASLLTRAENGELDHWSTQREALVALIVLLDQLSRHVHRGDDAQVRRNDARALPLAQTLLARGWDVALPAPQLVFALMPLRHSPTPARLHAVLAAVEACEGRRRAHDDLLEKFRRTTQNRLLHLPSSTDGDGDSNQAADTGDDAQALGEDDADAAILEREFVATDERALPAHRLYKAMHAYLTQMQASRYAYMAVSLSGGVDSMVVAYLLHKLRGLHGGFGVVAVHLDYANRAESGAECDYVRRWCARFGIAFHARRIDEVARASSKRDDYERVSRDIRYATYAAVLAQYGAPGMCVGHHRGDVQENVISNLMKGLSLLSLSGMTASSVVNGVRVWRPLLAFDKAAIFDFAHAFGVPYFKDTTPAWSTRGKLRRQLLPLLAELYGDGFLGHLSTLGAESTQCGELVERAVLAPILASVGATEVAVWFDCARLAGEPFFVWKEVLRAVCHAKLGNSMVREKPIRELMTKLARRRDGDDGMWITLKKGNRSYITTDRQLVIFRDNFFGARSWVPGSQAAAPGRIQIGETYEFGSWTIATTLVGNDDPRVAELTHRAPMTMWDVIKGDGVRYVIPHAPALVLSSERRIAALKRLEKPITDFMPLVAAASPSGASGGEQDAAAVAADRDTWVLVELQYCNRPTQT
ncbi:hypothetical protein PybrP1_011585 [[Pythium] brassicae (nom. inval.)]|nr:hypothetical protein PybrP1_011585 [[Pythium] brassicae (nom. inval.)]